MTIKGVRKNVSNGADCFFWHDTWLGSLPLKLLFPRLYLLVILPNANVDSYGFWEGINWVWTFTWKRELQPCDCAEKSQLDKLLMNVCLTYDGGEKVKCAYSTSGEFSAKSFTYELDKLSPIPHNDAIKGVWRGLVPHKI